MHEAANGLRRVLRELLGAEAEEACEREDGEQADEELPAPGDSAGEVRRKKYSMTRVGPNTHDAVNIKKTHSL